MNLTEVYNLYDDIQMTTGCNPSDKEVFATDGMFIRVPQGRYCCYICSKTKAQDIILTPRNAKRMIAELKKPLVIDFRNVENSIKEAVIRDFPELKAKLWS